MKTLVWGTRSLARKFGVTRDTIRNLIDTRIISPSTLKKRNAMYFVFDEKAQRKVKEFLDKNKKTGKRRSFYS
jgi:plasmid maintenance system antidote protein VapI